jgi:hypothetical protein
VAVGSRFVIIYNVIMEYWQPGDPSAQVSQRDDGPKGVADGSGGADAVSGQQLRPDTG